VPTELQHDGPVKFALSGLDLNVPVDLVPPTKYSRATNVVSKIEGQLQARDGSIIVAVIAAGLPIHTIFRLTQSNPMILSERLVGAGTALYTAPLPAGNVFTPLAGGPVFDGQPLSIVQFRFDGDPSGAWAIIANSTGMMKRRAGYYQVLGVAPPSVQATASAGGVGLLNSTTGTPYDWRYTYLNEVTLSESNGSPTMTASVQTLRPTTQNNPTPSYSGATAFLNPGNAYDGNLATFSEGTSALSSISNPPLTLNSIVACGWRGFAVASGALSSLVLSVVWSGVAQSVGVGNLSSINIAYSTDGGITIINTSGSNSSIGSNGTQTVVGTQTTFNVTLPPGTDVTKLIVYAVGGCTLTKAGSASVDAKVYEIYLTATLMAPVTSTLALTNQSANVCVTPPTDPQETAIRLYRRGGTLPNNWFQIGQFPVSSLVIGGCGAGTLQINDNVPDSQAELGEILPQDNFQPIQSVQAVNFPLPVIFGPYTGRVLGCGDPARPDAVYFSNVGNADIWGAEDWVVVADPGEQAMNGLEYNLRLFAFSRERLYIMLPNIIAGVTFTPAKTACRRGLKGRWALTSGEQGIYFVSKDGVYRSQGGPEQSIIDDSIRPLFPTREAPVGVPVNGYDAVNMDDENGLRLTYHNGEVWFYYTGATSGLRQLMIYDERRSRWRPGTYTPRHQIAYSEPNTDSSLLYGGVDGSLYAAGGLDDNGSPIPVDITTGAADQGRSLNLKEYLTVNFDVDPGGASISTPITVTPRVNGGLLAELALRITGSGRQRVTLPLNQNGNEVYAYNMEFDIQWSGGALVQPIFYQYETIYRHEPTETTHWELPRSSMGFEGFFHIRDIYMVLRSSADVTLTVTPDNSPPQTFVLPNTGGAKNTIYFKLAASKSTSYAFALDSAAPFRVYADEIEVRAKQWLTKLGYKNIPIIGREQVGKPFGLTNV
jgi:hypothetical protein